ncbi:tolB protein precursor [Minicystis rosea]|nr:tolB protein precursor [Minicystis rosea]
MIVRFSRLGLVLGTTLAGAVLAAACGGGSSSSQSTGGNTGGSTPTGSGGHAGHTGSGGSGGGFIFTGSGGSQQQGLDVQPSGLQTITVPIGQSTPTVAYTATLDGQPANVGWGVDKGDVGTVQAGPASTTVFTPKGTTGGIVTVTAGINMKTVSRQVMVKLTGEQNGPNLGSPAEVAQIPQSIPELTAGGGVGGVAGEGLGTAVTDPGVVTTLGSPTGDGSAQGLKLLYPYDKTVWPRGLLAPLLMWDWSVGDADAIQIELTTTSGSFSWKGTFAKPAILAQTGGKFIRHPIPQDIWEMATNTAGGSADQLTVKLTVAQGGQAYGPLSQTWTIASARLSGTIYYNSYGTQLAKNYGGAIGGDKLFGGAVLSIRVGDTGPKLVAGGNPGVHAPTQCRVCHSVAASGSRLVAAQQSGPTSSYDLSPSGSTEHVMTNVAEFPGVYPDGSMALTAGGQLLSLPNGTPLPATGLPAGTVAMPIFSPDGKLVAFNPANGKTLAVMSFDSATSTFSNQATIVSLPATPTDLRPGWPAFFPDGKSVIFHEQSNAGKDGVLSDLRTRKGAEAQIAWASIDGSNNVTPLDQLNGKGYLPKLAAPSTLSCLGDQVQVGKGAAGSSGIIDNPDLDHANDVNHNYEPTVNPIASGGYAWVVFTSRRLYGNVATIPPYCSDPRGVDLVTNITPKKLWVAAVDISGQPGSDASHPAFYLPAQELLAGNSRGFWTLDPCRPNGDGCETGDQCCNGFCQPNGPGGELVCSDQPPGSTCSGLQEKCETSADCCDMTNVCIGGFCTQKGPA